mmetsp:Transcript_42353/g.116817  ORF Transcript_42353/g.116817 Transcript_42353/m.116817 type:complete len:360 (+) Transcript_42353:80-1159(+)
MLSFCPSVVLTLHALIFQAAGSTQQLDTQDSSLVLLQQRAERVSAQPRAAVVYLVRNAAESLASLNISLNLLEANFCSRNGMGERYPVLIFSDESMQGRNFSFAPSCRLEWVVIPDFSNVPDYQEEAASAFLFRGKQDPGYGNMIRWYVRGIFDHPKVRELDYYMRMDDDSALLAPFHDDPFSRMAATGKRYGYYCSCSESDEFTQGFQQFSAEYAAQHKIQPRFAQGNGSFWPKEGDPVTMVYNNFEVMSVKWWRSPEVQDFVEAVDRSLGIWHSRWGDAIIRGMAISLFLKPTDLLLFSRIRYAHPLQNLVLPQEFVLLTNASVAMREVPKNFIVGLGLCQNDINWQGFSKPPEPDA